MPAIFSTINQAIFPFNSCVCFSKENVDCGETEIIFLVCRQEMTSVRSFFIEIERIHYKCSLLHTLSKYIAYSRRICVLFRFVRVTFPVLTGVLLRWCHVRLLSLTGAVLHKRLNRKPDTNSFWSLIVDFIYLVRLKLSSIQNHLW